MPAAGLNGHVVLVGQDGLGVRVLEELRELGVSVTAVSAQADTSFAEAARAARVPLVIGDLQSEDTMRKANVDRARACAFLAGGDLANLHLALEARELAPEAKIVVRLFDTSLAGPIRELVGDVAVLSASELAGPVFVAAALRGSAELAFRVGDRQVALQEVDIGDPRPRLALAKAESDEEEPELFPTEAVRVLGIVDQGQAGDAGPDPAARGDLEMRLAARQAGLAAGAARLSRASWLIFRGLVGVMDRRLAVVAVLFVLLLMGSTLVFDRGLGVDLLDAFYFTVTTVMSVGFGDINLLEASPAVKLFGTAIMVLGGLVLALVFALLTDAIVGARLAQALGQGPLPKRHHVIVCGIGRTGGRIIEDLVKAEVPCVAVERKEDAGNTGLLRRLGVPLVVGDAASGETLDSLKLGSARALMAMTNDDLANLQCALLARARAPDLRVVLRLFDQNLAVRVQRATDLDLSRSVSALAAPAFVAAVLGRRTTAMLPVGAEVMQVVGLTAEQAGEVKTLEQGCDARVLAVDGAVFPRPDLKVTEGSELVMVGTSRGLAELERRVIRSTLTAGKPAPESE